MAASGNHDQRGYLANWGEIYEGELREHYGDASNFAAARNLKGRLLIMHGELDDNVPPALSLRLADALIEANRDFELLILPNRDHFAFTSPYFIRRKWDFFVRELAGSAPPAGYAITAPVN